MCCFGHNCFPWTLREQRCLWLPALAPALSLSCPACCPGSCCTALPLILPAEWLLWSGKERNLLLSVPAGCGSGLSPPRVVSHSSSSSVLVGTAFLKVAISDQRSRLIAAKGSHWLLVICAQSHAGTPGRCQTSLSVGLDIDHLCISG